MKSINWWDEYEIKARYVPTFISVVPLVQFLLLFLGNSFWSSLSQNIGWMLITNIGLSLIIMLALVQLQCSFAKYWIEESIFGQGGINFPTTKMLLLNDSLISEERKEKLRLKIGELFQFSLPTKEEERKNPENAKLKAREAVGHIRNIVGKEEMVRQYNIRYGFIRNLIGGFIWSSIGSIGCSVIYGLQNDWKPMFLFLTFFVTHILLFILRKTILNKFAFTYADYLFCRFLDYKKGGNNNG